MLVLLLVLGLFLSLSGAKPEEVADRNMDYAYSWG